MHGFFFSSVLFQMSLFIRKNFAKHNSAALGLKSMIIETLLKKYINETVQKYLLAFKHWE